MKAPLDYALFYAGLGWRVFPVHTIREIKGKRWCSCSDAECEHQGKHPVAKLAPQGVKNATSAAPAIRKWWKVFPDANIGIATGRESGIVVIDVDTDESKGKVGADSLGALEEKHGRFPETVTVITGSGGLHYFFQYPALAEKIKSTTNALGQDIDSRGDGGYVVGVPSVHISAGQYLYEGSSDPTEGASLAPLPEWITDHLSSNGKQDHEPTHGPSQLGDVEVRELRSALAYVNPDDRQEWLNVGMALHSTGAGNQAFGIWTEWSQGSEKYNAADQRRVWASFKSGGITKSTIFQSAQSAGWINTASKRVANGDNVVEFSRDRSTKKEPPEWMTQLSRSERGAIHPCISNISLILRFDTRWGKVFGWDEFSMKIIKRRKPPFDIASTGEWEDSDDKKTTVWLSQNYGLRPTINNVADAIHIVAEYGTYHPIRDYLSRLKWDQQPRTKKWAITYLGAEDKPHTRYVAEKWLIAAVARVFQPGCKFDNVLILEGIQNGGKSSSLSILGGEWFSDTPFEIGSRDGFLAMRGHWIIELAELDSFNRAESTRAKHFFAASKDTYREPYGRRTIDVPRQCIFAGTTNQDEYLRDETGNRRYLPIACGDIDTDGLRRDRDQIWAEAVELYRGGEKWWFEGTTPYVAEEQEARYAQDAWEAQVKDWVNAKINIHKGSGQAMDKFFVTIADVLQNCLEIRIGDWTRADQMRVSGSLKRIGLHRRQFLIGDNRTWGYGLRFFTEKLT